MQESARPASLSRPLLIIGIVLIVIGAGLMDQAGRTQSALWWDISGAFAFAGFLVSAASLFLVEGKRLLPVGLKGPGRRGQP